jgi:hypothetical protein
MLPHSLLCADWIVATGSPLSEPRGIAQDSGSIFTKCNDSLRNNSRELASVEYACTLFGMAAGLLGDSIEHPYVETIRGLLELPAD